jgi:dipeptidyl aminopeptidase/acylaminoacyl peptidase
MKKLIRYTAAALTLLAPLSVYAHGGHMADSGWHGLLHVEHVMMLAGVAVLAGLFLLGRKR